MPQLNSSGLLTVFLGAVFAIVGFVANRQAPVFWGAILLLLVVVSWASALAVFLSLRAHALAIALRAPTGAVVACTTVRVSMVVEARRHTAPRGVVAQLVLPPSLDSPSVAFDFAAASRTEFDLDVAVRTAGEHVVRGVTLAFTDPFGHWTTTVDCPRPVVIRAHPQTPRVAGRFVARFTNPTEGEAATSRRGESPAFSDIDLYRPGDPLRRIAWTASLRHRKLLVKRTEEPEVTPVVVVLDASAGMRRGPEGARAIDVAVSRTAALVRSLGRARIPVGLVVFHRRVVARLRLARTESARAGIIRTLVRLPALVDPSLQVLDEETLIRAVALSLAAVGHTPSAHASAVDLAHEAAAWMARHLFRERNGEPDGHGGRTPPRAPRDVDTTLLAFASALGLVFNPPCDIDTDQTIIATNRAIRVAGEILDGPGRVVLVSNFAGFCPVHATTRNFSFLARVRSKPRVDVWPVTASAPFRAFARLPAARLPAARLPAASADDRTRELAAGVVGLVERADQVAFLRALARVYPRIVTAPESERAWQARAAG